MSIAFAVVADPLRAARVDSAFVETADAVTAAGLRVWTYDAERRRIIHPRYAIVAPPIDSPRETMNAEELGTGSVSPPVSSGFR